MTRPDGGAVFSLISIDTKTGHIRTIYKSSGHLLSPSVSSDGRRVAYAEGQPEGALIEVGVPSGIASELLTMGGAVWSVDWAPSGTHYLFASDLEGESAIYDHNPQEHLTRRLITASSDYFPAKPSALYTPRWAPKGERFAFLASVAYSKKTFVAHTSGGRPVNIDPNADSFGASWSPDGLWIAYYRVVGNRPSKTQLAKIGTGVGETPTIIAAASEYLVPTLTTAWSPDGESILYEAPDGLTITSVDGKRRRLVTSRRPAVAYGFSRNGSQVYAVTRNRSNDRSWDLFSVDVKTGVEKLLGPVNVSISGQVLVGFSLHPDGKRFATSMTKYPYDLWMLEGFEQGEPWPYCLFGC